jgi:hypothetical protein
MTAPNRQKCSKKEIAQQQQAMLQQQAAYQQQQQTPAAQPQQGLQRTGPESTEMG